MISSCDCFALLYVQQAKTYMYIIATVMEKESCFFLQMTTHYRPSYKDNECYQQTTYGCKDKYGVIYPVWYNNTVSISYKNTDLPQRYREYLEPYMYNMAESVYMHRYRDNHQQSQIYRQEHQQHGWASNQMYFTQIVRPNENNVSYIINPKDMT